MKSFYRWVCVVCLCCASRGAKAQVADLILLHGKIVTVDNRFSIQKAIGVKDGRIIEVGTDAAVMKHRGPKTIMVDLKGKTVLPGLMDSHTHPLGAAMTEFDHTIPSMETIADVLAYVRGRAAQAKPGEWIEVRQVFITRLKEQRYPTRAELDEAAPHNPVLFATGPDGSLNSSALKLSGIDKDFKVTDGGPGHAEKDPATGEPTGILRGMTRYVKAKATGRKPKEEDILRRLLELFKDYNAIGITSIGDRDASPEAIGLYTKMLQKGNLPVRISISHHIDTLGPIDKIQKKIRDVALHPLHKPGPMLQIVGIKTFLDGGMLTGSAYMQQPWGVSKIYSITDPNYKGVLLIPKERLEPMVRTAIENGLQFTAHSVGDGAVQTLLDVYEEINHTTPIKVTRPCVTHSNFMSAKTIGMVRKMGVVVDIQPAWLYLDTRTLAAQFGYERLRYFQPLKSLFRAGAVAGGGSDHMQKIGDMRSINLYNPFLGMWTAITRKAKGYSGRLHPEEALSRQEAIRFYTRNNAYILFREKDAGSLEKGKRADMVVLNRDIMTCPVDQIRDIRPVTTYLDGKAVFSR